MRPIKYRVLLMLPVLLYLAPLALALDHDPEAKNALKRARESVIFDQPLGTRVSRLSQIALCVLFLSGAGTLLGMIAGRKGSSEDSENSGEGSTRKSRTRYDKALIVSAVIAASTLILTGVRTQVLKADKDSAEELLAELTTYRDAVEDQFVTYDEHLQVARAAEEEKQEDWEEEYQRRRKLSDEALARLVILHEKGRELIGRARKLVGNPPPARETKEKASVPLFGPVYAAAAATRKWMESLPYDPDYAQVVGEGVCSTAFAAREYARYEGRRKLAQQLDPKASGMRINTIIAALESSFQDRDTYSATEKGRYRAYAWVRLFRETGLTKMRSVGRGVPPPVRWAAESRGLSVSGASPGGRGTFAFDFAPALTKAGPRLRLDRISVREDGSAGSTRWAFEVQVDGKYAFSMATHRLDDSGKPTFCWPQESEQLTASGGTPKSISIVGYIGDEIKP